MYLLIGQVSLRSLNRDFSFTGSSGTERVVPRETRSFTGFDSPWVSRGVG